VRRLIDKGFPFSASIAYLLGGPIVNPIVAASTALAYTFDWRIVILRLGLGYALAVIIGLIMGRLFSTTEAITGIDAELKTNSVSCGCHHHSLEHTNRKSFTGTGQAFPVIYNQESVSTPCGCGCAHYAAVSWIDKAMVAVNHAMDDFSAVGHYLIIGAFIAALAQTYIDRPSFLSLTASPVLSVVLMMVLAILLNLCSEADAFIAASFRGFIPVPAQVAFLLTGPMFDLKLLLMYQNVFRRRAIIALASLILVAVLAIAVCLEMFNGIIR
jgi:uncharacterized membrane protein YraQ (UPF0718 family)